MKQKDWAVVLIVVFVSGVLSLVLSNTLFGKSKQQEQVEVVEAITAEFTKPNEKYFNKNSIDPTQIIRIGDGSNESPFN